VVKGAPSDELLSQYNPARLKGSTSHELNASDNEHFCVDEFARLACIITQPEEARRALLDSQLDLTRAQLDRSERRGDFECPKITDRSEGKIFDCPKPSVELRAFSMPA
jgi:hypothetical protein